MTKRHYSLIGALALCSLAVLGLSVLRPSGAQAQQYPIMNDIANKIIQKYKNSSCEQLWEEEPLTLPQPWKNSASSDCCAAIRKCAPRSSIRLRRPSPTRCSIAE